MIEKGNLYPFDSILKLVELGSYINDYSKADEIKAKSIIKIYHLIINNLTENKEFFDVSHEEIKLKSLETLQIIKRDLPKIFALYQKQINEIKIADILNFYYESDISTTIQRKVWKYQDKLFNKKKHTVYTVNEAMKILGYSHKASIYNHINKKNIRVKKLGKRMTLISEDDLSDFVLRTYKISLEEYIKLSPQEKKSLHKN